MGKQWQVDIDGKKRVIEVEHQGKKGSVRVDGDMVMEWKLSYKESSHHLTRIGSRLLGIHVYEDSREPIGWRYDCSLDGVSVVTQNSVWIQESTPYEGGYRRWDLDLSGHQIQLGLRHKSLSGSILLELNGEPVATLNMDVHSPDGDYVLHLLEHRVGIHIRETEDFSFRYDCSVEGRSVTTGQRMASTRLLSNEGGFAWIKEVDGSPRLFRLEHRPFRNRITLWVDGEKVDSVGSFWEDRKKENWYSFRWSHHHVMVQVREVQDLEYEYLPVMDGRSVTTGEPVQPPEIEEVETESTRAWDLELSDGSHRVEVDGTFALRIRVDGSEVAKKRLWDWGDSWHSFSIGNHSCAILFQLKTFTHRTMLFVDGINVSTGKEMLPLKVISSGGRPKWWMFRTPQGVRRVELYHQRWLGGVCQIRVDGERVLKKRRWDRDSTFHFDVDGLPCRLRIDYQPEEDRYEYHLWVNDHRIETGKLVADDPEGDRLSHPPAPSWGQRLRSGGGVYLFGVATLYVLHSFVRWFGWDDPRELLWYFTLPLFPAVTQALQGSKTEKWLFAALGIIMLVLAGVGLYFWIWDR